MINSIQRTRTNLPHFAKIFKEW